MNPLRIPLFFAFMIVPAFLQADPGTEEDKQALRDLAKIYQEAIANDDLSPLEAHLAAEFTAVMVTGERIEGFVGLRDYWDSLKELIGEGGSYRVTLEPEDSDFRDDIAVAKGSATEVVTLPSGDEITFPSRWTAVCIRDGDTWKLLRAQGTTNPVDNPFTARAVKASMLTAGVIAGIVGLLIGFLVGSRRGK